MIQCWIEDFMLSPQGHFCHAERACLQDIADYWEPPWSWQALLLL